MIRIYCWAGGVRGWLLTHSEHKRPTYNWPSGGIPWRQGLGGLEEKRVREKRGDDSLVWDVGLDTG